MPESKWAFEPFCLVGFYLGATMILMHTRRTYIKAKERGTVDRPPKSSVASLKPSTSSGKLVYPHEHEKKMLERLQSDGPDDSDIERTKVVVRVPATSANLGPGFDTIGMAVDMWSEYTIERADKFEVICVGEGSHDMPLDETNLVCMALKAAFKKAGKAVPTLRYHLVNRIPYARGLGSSSAAIVGGLVAGFVLAGHRVPTWGSEELLNLAANIEGKYSGVLCLSHIYIYTYIYIYIYIYLYILYHCIIKSTFSLWWLHRSPG
jgi:hypothetical protein